MLLRFIVLQQSPSQHPKPFPIFDLFVLSGVKTEPELPQVGILEATHNPPHPTREFG